MPVRLDCVRFREGDVMTDLLMVIVMVGFFIGCIAYVRGCERL
jgi:hypothetical protein